LDRLMCVSHHGDWTASTLCWDSQLIELIALLSSVDWDRQTILTSIENVQAFAAHIITYLPSCNFLLA
jgi:hypothetical protein